MAKRKASSGTGGDQAQPLANTCSDGSLLNRVLSGDDAAAAEIYARHSPRLLEVARARLSKFLSSRVDPEDIVQSTFKSFFRRAQHGGYRAPESGDLFNLLIVIAMRKVNARADYHQAAARDVRRTETVEEKHLGARSYEEPLRVLCLTIEELCSRLSPVQRDIVHRRLEGYSVAEIAAEVGRSKRTVERELQHFRQAMASYFEP